MNEEKFPDTLYHYTTPQGFLGILQSRSFWASHILFQNDISEGKKAFSIYDEELKKKNIKLDNDIMDLLKMSTTSGIYTVSFSENGDDLNMWRGYSPKPFGICIGFDTKLLMENLKKYNQFSDEEACECQINFELKKCIYDENDQKKIIEDFCNSINPASLDMKNIFQKMQENSDRFKDKHFSSEKEFRICITNTCDEHFSDRHKVRFSKNRFIPYFEVFYADNKRVKLIDCIKNIRIGPYEDSKQVVGSVCSALDIYKANVKEDILSSNIPYIG